MRRNWLRALASLTVVGAISCLGCGQSSTTVDPSQTQTPEEIQQEMQEREAAMQGDVDPSKDAKPAEEKPADEKPAEEKPAEGEGAEK